MRRAVALGLALALIVALTACGFMRWPLSAAKVGDSLNAAFGASPRLHWSAPETASFSLLPRPSVRIADARLDDAYGVNLLSAPEARLNLALIELLRGRFIPTGVVLVSPTVTVDIDRPPFAGAAGETETPPASRSGEGKQAQGHSRCQNCRAHYDLPIRAIQLTSFLQRGQGGWMDDAARNAPPFVGLPKRRVVQRTH